MRIETCVSPELGLVRVQHVRAALGAGFRELKVVELVVLAGGVITQTVELVPKPSGRGEHSVFACPTCKEPRTVLYSSTDLRLACAGCSRRRTRHQNESSSSDWGKNGHVLEDRLLRGVMRKNNTATKIRGLRAVVGELVAGDHDRFTSAMLAASAALQVADADLTERRHATSERARHMTRTARPTR